ncbi:hypothetical protein CMUS01_00940 [Colletotrichum musicola]|uniref:Uncharacterized protein n=1 Tax=Colletotrichum musicola TaxID=2175873 RepID=A0A8H6NY01_9PEZI|nr:hypothetical protein CMUS01_00940 [Colletotrichum musicola]
MKQKDGTHRQEEDSVWRCTTYHDPFQATSLISQSFGREAAMIGIPVGEMVGTAAHLDTLSRQPGLSTALSTSTVPLGSIPV